MYKAMFVKTPTPTKYEKNEYENIFDLFHELEFVDRNNVESMAYSHESDCMFLTTPKDVIKIIYIKDKKNNVPPTPKGSLGIHYNEGIERKEVEDTWHMDKGGN